MKQILEASRVVTTFTGTDTTSWRNATQDVEVLVIPSFFLVAPEPRSFRGRNVLPEGLRQSGRHPNYPWGVRRGEAEHQFVNTLFDTALADVNSAIVPSTPTANVAGTTFAGASGALPWLDETEAIAAVSLPAFATSLYKNAAGDSTVAAFQYGKGQVIWIGRDYYDALPPPGTTDGGWNDILNRAISVTDFLPNGVVIEGGKGNDKVSLDGSANGKGFASTDRDDVIVLNKGKDKAFAGGGHDFIDGGKDNDRLHGGDGDDTITGGKRKDKLWGDGGGDYFVFDQKPGRSQADAIKDFVDGEDLIVLQLVKFGGLTAGEMTAAQFAQHIVYEPNGWLSFDGQKFAKLQSGGLAIDASDFVVW